MSQSFLSIIIAALSSFGIGYLWYGPLFGKTWLKLSQLEKLNPKLLKQNMTQIMILNLALSLLTAGVLAHLIMTYQVSNLLHALILGIVVWLGFIFATQLSDGLYQKQPPLLTAINSGYRLVMIETMVIILVIL